MLAKFPSQVLHPHNNATIQDMEFSGTEWEDHVQKSDIFILYYFGFVQMSSEKESQEY